jgi:hypothetical protein
MKTITKKILVFSVALFLVFGSRIVFADWQIQDDYGLPGGTITDIVVNILNWMLGLIGVVGIIGFVIAGILYLTSVGDSGRIETAKNAMMFSIIGVIVALSGFVALKAIETMLEGRDDAF